MGSPCWTGSLILSQPCIFGIVGSSARYDSVIGMQLARRTGILIGIILLPFILSRTLRYFFNIHIRLLYYEYLEALCRPTTCSCCTPATNVTISQPSTSPNNHTPAATRDPASFSEQHRCTTRQKRDNVVLLFSAVVLVHFTRRMYEYRTSRGITSLLPLCTHTHTHHTQKKKRPFNKPPCAAKCTRTSKER